MEFHARTEENPEYTLVIAEGELDAYTAPRLRDTLKSSLENGARHLIVDLSAVPFIDSAGLGVLIGCRKSLADRDGTLDLVIHDEHVKKVMSITRLDEVFAIHVHKDAAIKAIAAAAIPANP